MRLSGQCKGLLQAQSTRVETVDNKMQPGKMNNVTKRQNAASAMQQLAGNNCIHTVKTEEHETQSDQTLH